MNQAWNCGNRKTRCCSAAASRAGMARAAAPCSTNAKPSQPSATALSGGSIAQRRDARLAAYAALGRRPAGAPVAPEPAVVDDGAALRGAAAPQDAESRSL